MKRGPWPRASVRSTGLSKPQKSNPGHFIEDRGAVTTCHCTAFPELPKGSLPRHWHGGSAAEDPKSPLTLQAQPLRNTVGTCWGGVTESWEEGQGDKQRVAHELDAVASSLPGPPGLKSAHLPPHALALLLSHDFPLPPKEL